jgi:hypothetical protein
MLKGSELNISRFIDLITVCSVLTKSCSTKNVSSTCLLTVRFVSVRCNFFSQNMLILEVNIVKYT